MHIDAEKVFKRRVITGIERIKERNFNDVLKARLMSELQGNKKDQQVFATIWDACRDMSGYVQMHFTPTQRGELFNWDWAQIPSHRMSDYRNLSQTSSPQTEQISLKVSVSFLLLRELLLPTRLLWCLMRQPLFLLL